MPGPYDALLFDLYGTLVGEDSEAQDGAAIGVGRDRALADLKVTIEKDGAIAIR